MRMWFEEDGFLIIPLRQLMVHVNHPNWEIVNLSVHDDLKLSLSSIFLTDESSWTKHIP